MRAGKKGGRIVADRSRKGILAFFLERRDGDVVDGGDLDLLLEDELLLLLVDDDGDDRARSVRELPLDMALLLSPALRSLPTSESAKLVVLRLSCMPRGLTWFVIVVGPSDDSASAAALSAEPRRLPDRHRCTPWGKLRCAGAADGSDASSSAAAADAFAGQALLSGWGLRMVVDCYYVSCGSWSRLSTLSGSPHSRAHGDEEDDAEC